MFLNFIEESLILVGCVPIFVFGLLVAIPVGIASSVLGLKFFETTVLI